MKAILLSEMPDFAHCVTEKLMIYALGRGLQRYDTPSVNQIQAKLASQNYPFQTLVFEVIHSLPFQQRRAETKAQEIAKR